MKTKKTILCMMLGAVALFTSCTSEEQETLSPENGSEQKGQFVLNLNSNADFSVQTRALNENAYSNTDNFTVQIINASSQVVMECKGSELSTYLPKELSIGSYEVKAFYGTESKASRNDFRVEGSNTFTIQAEQQTSVDVACAPTCGKLYVNFDPSMATYCSDYNVTYGGTEALGAETIAWAKADSEPWYVALTPNGETINYTINLTVKDSYAFTDGNGQKQTQAQYTGSFQLQRNHAHKLTVKPSYTPSTEGGLEIQITIDDTTNDHEVTFTVPVSWI